MLTVPPSNSSSSSVSSSLSSSSVHTMSCDITPTSAVPLHHHHSRHPFPSIYSPSPSQPSSHQPTQQQQQQQQQQQPQRSTPNHRRFLPHQRLPRTLSSSSNSSPTSASSSSSSSSLGIRRTDSGRGMKFEDLTDVSGALSSLESQARFETNTGEEVMSLIECMDRSMSRSNPNPNSSTSPTVRSQSQQWGQLFPFLSVMGTSFKSPSLSNKRKTQRPQKQQRQQQPSIKHTGMYSSQVMPSAGNRSIPKHQDEWQPTGGLPDDDDDGAIFFSDTVEEYLAVDGEDAVASSISSRLGLAQHAQAPVHRWCRSLVGGNYPERSSSSSFKSHDYSKEKQLQRRGFPPISPYQNHRAEVIHNLLDRIWRVVVPIIYPHIPVTTNTLPSVKNKTISPVNYQNDSPASKEDGIQRSWSMIYHSRGSYPSQSSRERRHGVVGGWSAQERSKGQPSLVVLPQKVNNPRNREQMARSRRRSGDPANAGFLPSIGSPSLNRLYRYPHGDSSRQHASPYGIGHHHPRRQRGVGAPKGKKTNHNRKSPISPPKYKMHPHVNRQSPISSSIRSGAPILPPIQARGLSPNKNHSLYSRHPKDHDHALELSGEKQYVMHSPYPLPYYHAEIHRQFFGFDGKLQRFVS